MGAGQSTEKVIYNDTPIQFSNDLVNHLSDELASPDTNPERQSVLDHHIRSRIHAEIARLRETEEEVKAEIERTLERENIDRERASAEPDIDGSASEDDRASQATDGAVRTSLSLREDLKEVQSKVERYQKRRALNDIPRVKATSELLVECYRKNARKPLDCWKEVSEFKDSVTQAEQQFIDSMR